MMIPCCKGIIGGELGRTLDRRRRRYCLVAADEKVPLCRLQRRSFALITYYTMGICAVSQNAP